MKIGRPVIRRVAEGNADYYASDCPMAGHQIESGLEPQAETGAHAHTQAHTHAQGVKEPTHPMKLLRMAYGI